MYHQAKLRVCLSLMQDQFLKLQTHSSIGSLLHRHQPSTFRDNSPYKFCVKGTSRHIRHKLCVKTEVVSHFVYEPDALQVFELGDPTPNRGRGGVKASQMMPFESVRHLVNTFEKKSPIILIVVTNKKCTGFRSDTNLQGNIRGTY